MSLIINPTSLAGPSIIFRVFLLKMVNGQQVLTFFIEWAFQWLEAYHSDKNYWFLKVLISKLLDLFKEVNNQLSIDFIFNSLIKSHWEIPKKLIKRVNILSWGLLGRMIWVVENCFCSPLSRFKIDKFHFIISLWLLFQELFVCIYHGAAYSLTFKSKFT